MTLLTIPPVKLSNFTTNNVSLDDGSFDLNRFNGVKELLPANAIVGYLPLTQETEADVLPESFYLTQYAISPRLLSYSTEPEYIIGNFTDKNSAQKSIKGFSVIKNFGNGVILLRHRL